MALLSTVDHARWQRLGVAVSEVVEPRLTPSVLANRAAGASPWWRPQPIGPALAVARRMARALPGPVIVRADVAAFYPSVRPATLFDALRRLSVPAGVAGTAAELLEGWGSEGYAGLPIGPPPSAVMANAVLAPVDAALGAHPFLRWVDDYLVSVPSARIAADVLDGVHIALDRVGLRPAPSKTGLLEAGPALRWLGASGG